MLFSFNSYLMITTVTISVSSLVHPSNHTIFSKKNHTIQHPLSTPNQKENITNNINDDQINNEILEVVDNKGEMNEENSHEYGNFMHQEEQNGIQTIENQDFYNQNIDSKPENRTQDHELDEEKKEFEERRITEQNYYIDQEKNKEIKTSAEINALEEEIKALKTELETNYKLFLETTFQELLKIKNDLIKQISDAAEEIIKISNNKEMSNREATIKTLEEKERTLKLLLDNLEKSIEESRPIQIKRTISEKEKKLLELRAPQKQLNVYGDKAAASAIFEENGLYTPNEEEIQFYNSVDSPYEVIVESANAVGLLGKILKAPNDKEGLIGATLVLPLDQWQKYPQVGAYWKLKFNNIKKMNNGLFIALSVKGAIPTQYSEDEFKAVFENLEEAIRKRDEPLQKLAKEFSEPILSLFNEERSELTPENLENRIIEMMNNSNLFFDESFQREIAKFILEAPDGEKLWNTMNTFLATHTPENTNYKNLTGIAIFTALIHKFANHNALGPLSTSLSFFNNIDQNMISQKPIDFYPQYLSLKNNDLKKSFMDFLSSLKGFEKKAQCLDNVLKIINTPVSQKEFFFDMFTSTNDDDIKNILLEIVNNNLKEIGASEKIPSIFSSWCLLFFRDLYLLNNPQLELEIWKYNAPELSERILDSFYDTLYINESSVGPISPLYKQKKPGKIIANNEGYHEGEQSDKQYTKGGSLKAQDGSPIGYNVYFPENFEKKQIKSVVVKVYGGNATAGNLHYTIQETRGDVELALLEDDAMVIELNLPDLNNLTVHQGKTPASVFYQVQNAIHDFFVALKENPESLHEDIGQAIKGKDIPFYLYGHSYGGLTTVRQAQLYPKTWTGYIATSAALSMDTQIQRSLQDADPLMWNSTYFPYLNAIDYIENLQDPILILGNASDHNVNMKGMTDFYEKAKILGKSSLVQPMFIYKGNDFDILLNPEKAAHGVPLEEKQLAQYTGAILGFINNESKNQSEEKWDGEKGIIRSGMFDPLASAESQFLSLIYKDFKNQLKAGKDVSLLKEDYKSKFVCLKYMDYLLSDQKAFANFVRDIENALIADKDNNIIKNSIKSDAQALKQYIPFIFKKDMTVKENSPLANPELKTLYASGVPSDLLQDDELPSFLSEGYKKILLSQLKDLATEDPRAFSRPNEFKKKKFQVKRLLRNLLMGNLDFFMSYIEADGRDENFDSEKKSKGEIFIENNSGAKFDKVWIEWEEFLRKRKDYKNP